MYAWWSQSKYCQNVARLIILSKTKTQHLTSKGGINSHSHSMGKINFPFDYLQYVYMHVVSVSQFPEWSATWLVLSYYYCRWYVLDNIHDHNIVSCKLKTNKKKWRKNSKYWLPSLAPLLSVGWLYFSLLQMNGQVNAFADYLQFYESPVLFRKDPDTFWPHHLWYRLKK